MTDLDPPNDPQDHEHHPFLPASTILSSSSINQPQPSPGSFVPLFHRCCRVKPLSTIQSAQLEEENNGSSLKRVLNMTDLVAYGLGSTLGAGLFVVAGQAAVGSGTRAGAGPAVTISFIVAAIACLFSALCYAEFASRIPVAGSAYSFAYASLGEGVAWFIGWNLTLEYGVSAAAVARAWEQYVVEFFRLVGFPLPTWTYALVLIKELNINPSNATNITGYIALDHDVAGAAAAAVSTSGVTISLLSPLIIVFCSFILIKGAKTSAKFNFIIMIFNLMLVLFIICVGSTKVETSHWTPFAPSGIRGIIDNAGFVFFSYIGFDCVCTLAEELKHPQRDLPRGIVFTLIIVTTLYVLVSFVLTGMKSYTMISVRAPLADAFTSVHLPWATFIVALGTISTLTATTLCSLYGQPRIFYRMSRDGLLFEKFSTINQNGVPTFGVWITCLGACLLSGFFDLGSLAEMISIGTLLAFSTICLGVLVLRYGKDADVEEIKIEVNEMLRYSCLISFVIGESGCNMLLLYGDNSTLAKLGTYYFCLIAIVAIVVLWWYVPQLKYDAKFKCPWVPLVPCIGITINTNLIFINEIPSPTIHNTIIVTQKRTKVDKFDLKNLISV